MASELFRLRWQVDGKDYAEIDRIFEVAKGTASNLKSVFLSIIPLISAEIRGHFQSQSGPAGRWQALSPQYAQWKSKFAPGESILQLRHKLINAVIQKEAFGAVREIKATGLEYGVDLSKIPYARIHDLGGKAGRGARIPQREYLFLSLKGQDDVSQFTARSIWDNNLAGRTRIAPLKLPSWLKGLIP